MNPHTDLDEFPPTVDEPDNSDLNAPTAATINTGTDGALDRTFYLHKRLVAEACCNWGDYVNLGATSEHAAFGLGLFWWVTSPGNADKIRVSFDYGETWADVSIGLDNLGCNDVDFDPSANAVVPNHNSTTVYDFTFSTSTWAHHTAQLTGTVNKPRVRYEPVNGNWGIFYNDTAFGMRFYHSTTRASWSASALPVAFTGAGTFTAHMGQGGGYFVVAFRSSSTQVQIASAPASLGFTGSTITTAMSSVSSCSDPIYSAEDGVWMIALAGLVGASSATEFYTSTDNGVTWTLTKTLSASGISVLQLANIGHLWLGMGVGGSGVYSLDLGQHWYAIGKEVTDPTGTSIGLASGGGGFLVFDNGGSFSGVRPSFRLGNLGASALS